MGRYLLDTHTAIWFFNGDNALSETAKNLILDTSNFKYLNIASAWEIAIKHSIGKLDIAGNTADFIHDAETNGLFLSLLKLHTLPFLNRCP